MRIDFTGALPASSADQDKNAETIAHISSAGSEDGKVTSAGYRLDISGIVKDNRAYEGQGTTGEDVCSGISSQDMTNARNYMTVMSNSLSSDDYGKLMEDGDEPSYLEAGTTSTIIDAVKVALIKSGTSVEGYTTDIDKESIEKITGSETYANELADSFAKYDIPVTKENVDSALSAADEAHRITSLQDGSIKYMVSNGVSPTISGLYEAQYSASGDGQTQPQGYYASDTDGYYAEKAENPDWDKLSSQIDGIIADSGLDDSTETQNECRWLIDKGIPLTSESLGLLDEINSIEIPLPDSTIFDAASSAISDGKNADEGNLADTRNQLQKAQDLIKETSQISDEAVSKAVTEGRTLTIKSLSASQREIDVYLSEDHSGSTSTDNGKTSQDVSEGTSEAASTENTGTLDEKISSAEKTLASVRLGMTFKANLILLESGFSIDTAPIEKLASALEDAGTTALARMFGDGTSAELESRNTQYEDTLSVSSSLKEMPAALIGGYSVSDSSFTLQNAYDSGLALQKKYEQAGQAYETVGTSPRSDLGDSIQKAFANVDDLLDDIGMEKTGDNERAVRILGYNSMDITEENVERVRAADTAVRSVINKMTPATTLSAVRNGVDTLNTNISVLSDSLDSSTDSSGSDASKFGRFIYKLDSNGQITDDEKTSCIGIYRMFNQIEKSGDAAVGAVLNAGAEMTFGNLLTAVRSSRKGSIDKVIDDSFSGVDSVRTNESITEQINAAFNDSSTGSKGNTSTGSGSDEEYAAESGDNAASDDKVTYYRSLASEVLSEMTPKKILEADPQSDTTITEFADEIKSIGSEDDADSEYISTRMAEIQNQKISEDSADEMFTYGLSVTIDNIAAIENLRHNRGSWFRTADSIKDDDTDDTDNGESSDESITGIADLFTDKDSAVKAISEVTQKMDEKISEASESMSLGYVDLKSLQSCHTQLGIIRKLSNEENYEVPVEINGEKTSIHLKMIHDSENGGRVSVTMDTEKTGSTAADLSVTDGRVSGYIACSSSETASYLKTSQSSITGELKGSIDIITSKDVNLDRFEQSSDEGYRKSITSAEGSADRLAEGTDTNTLYRLAASFIKTITGGIK